MVVDRGASPRLGGLALLALGVVFGDIGTSPLYAFKEAFNAQHGLAVTEANVLAALSAFFWALALIISLKYVWIMLRYDNDGEGGVLALTALVHRVAAHAPRRVALAAGAGVFAAALFYGDAIITPAISVLSAMEGLSIAAPGFDDLIVPLALGVLIGLFAVQKAGTAGVGRWFGPVTLLWFATLAALGLASIAQTPAVLAALDPRHALAFAWAQPGTAFLLLSAVFLALTGGEALYADMGHFGRKAVRLAWYGVVWPALTINYFGQGALILREPAAAQNPFYLLAPAWLVLPLVGLATAATVIASQATISGAYSMTLQASRLGYLPRLRLLHTSDSERGQIYIPSVNWLMLLAVLILVLEFQSSGALAAAYGIAVAGTMIVTTLLTLCVVLAGPRKHGLLAVLVVLGGLELCFFAANLTKLDDGGWFPLLLGAGIFAALSTWKQGSALVALQRRKIDVPMPAFLASTYPEVPRVEGTAIYLTSAPDIVPSALFHNLRHNKVLHRRIVFLHVVNEDVPYVAEDRRLRLVSLAPDIHRLDVHFGFREEPDLPQALEGLARLGLVLEPMLTTYFVARATIVDGPGGLGRWRCALFAWMTRQAEGAATYYRLPANQVVELGTQLLL